MSASPPYGQHVGNTSAENGSQAAAGIFHGNVSFGNSPDSSLKNLPVAENAPFNAYKRQQEPPCLEDTRVELLQEINKWADGADGADTPCIFWLSGLAGEGKSTLSRTVSRKWHEKRRLGASFFFSRGDGDTSHAGKFVTSIAAQFADSVPALHNHIRHAIEKRPYIAKLALEDQWQELILDPLSELDGKKVSYLLVVDALDECDDDGIVEIILKLFAKAKSLQTVRLRVFLTSRPEVRIQKGLNEILDTTCRELNLHSIPRSIVDKDIQMYLQRKLASDGLGEQEITQLVQKAAGLFIWASTACRFIGDGPSAEKRISIILEGSVPAVVPEDHRRQTHFAFLQGNLRSLFWKANNIFFWIMIVCGFVRNGLLIKQWLHALMSDPVTPNDQLDWIYLTILNNSLRPTFTRLDVEEFSRSLRKVLGSIVVLFSSLPVGSLGNLLSMPGKAVKQTLRDLHAILDIPKDDNYAINLHHPSFRDFLLDKARCYDDCFWIDEKQAHQVLADNCIRLLSTSLKEDICAFKFPGMLAADVQNKIVEQHLSPEVQYASLYWVHHLQKGGNQLHDRDQVHEFLNAHLLHWLEALGWMRGVSDGIQSIIMLESIACTCESPNLQGLILDMKRFALYNRPAIELAPLQVYSSALVFAPAKSRVRIQFATSIPRWIQQLPKMSIMYNTALATLEGHDNFVRAVAFSSDGKQLASSSEKGTIKLWDGQSAAALATLQCHSRSIVFEYSPNGKRIASAQDDGTINLWDTKSGAAVTTLQGHQHRVNAVAFSPDGNQLASASSDGTVKLWNCASGKWEQETIGSSFSFSTVVFSGDGERLAAVSDPGTIWLWDVKSRTEVKTWTVNESTRIILTFSRDGTRLALASHEYSICLRDGKSGAEIETLIGHDNYVKAIAFSQDGERLASASSDRTIRLWNGISGAWVATLVGHGGPVSAVTFSQDSKRLASAAWDHTVRLWDGKSGALLMTLRGHLQLVNAVAFSPDDKWLASASHDYTIKLWDCEMRAGVEMIECHSDWISSVVFSRDSKQLASASDDNMVKLWDCESGTLVMTLKGLLSQVHAVAFSPDGKRLASGSTDGKVRLWDTKSGTELAPPFMGPLDGISTVGFSPDGKRLVSGSRFDIITLWDVESRERLHEHEHSDHGYYVNAITFSPDGKWLASWCFGQAIRLWDVEKWEPVRFLKVERSIKHLSFSPDGSCLVTDRGVFRIDWDSDRTSILEHEQLGLSGSDQWIAIGQRNFLWLPPEYRATSDAISGPKVVLGHVTGLVSFFRFDVELLDRLMKSSATH